MKSLNKTREIQTAVVLGKTYRMVGSKGHVSNELVKNIRIMTGLPTEFIRSNLRFLKTENKGKIWKI